jgi:hypothetical protein
MNESRQRDGASFGIGIVLVSVGMVFLAGELAGIRLGEWLWPFLIIGPGLLFFLGMILGGPSAGGLAIPGSIITTVGVLLLFQNTIGHFESWAYAWALIVVAVGLGLIMNGVWSNKPGLTQSGWRLAGLGVVLFAIGFFFFELILNIGGFGDLLGGRFLPSLLLIGVGVLALMRGIARRAPGDAPPAELPAAPATSNEHAIVAVAQPVPEVKL